jgi:dihydroorotate dehydrogenase
MDYYSLLRPAIFRLQPETAHHLVLAALTRHLVPAQPDVIYPCLTQRLFGLDFINPIGLAAGFDKNAEAVSGLSQQGFGFLELGTVTPLAQAGNPKPRIFRLTQDEAVINRLGFNNQGLEEYTHNWRASPSRSLPLGANIGKNKDTEDALSDYIKGLDAVFPFADYITINISSPNTAGLRDLQAKEALEHLLKHLIARRNELTTQQKRFVPLLLKIAPDLTQQDVQDIALIARDQKIDGLIISNTTTARPLTLQNHLRLEKGGLSGKPLFQSSTALLAEIYRLTEGKIPLIGVGGVASGADAYAKIKAGASLVQLYSALVYQGFGLVTRIKQELITLLEQDGFSHISEAVGKEV